MCIIFRPLNVLPPEILRPSSQKVLAAGTPHNTPFVIRHHASVIFGLETLVYRVEHPIPVPVSIVAAISFNFSSAVQLAEVLWGEELWETRIEE